MTDRAEIERLLVNGRTPEEIKHWMRCCSAIASCYSCPYNQNDYCVSEAVLPNALAYMHYLEAKQPKWIGVKEELPVKQFRVIVRTGHNMVAAGWRSYHVDVKGGELWEVDGAHNYRNDVTHWMPLPEPPKEETNETTD